MMRRRRRRQRRGGEIGGRCGWRDLSRKGGLWGQEDVALLGVGVDELQLAAQKVEGLGGVDERLERDEPDGEREERRGKRRHSRHGLRRRIRRVLRRVGRGEERGGGGAWEGAAVVMLSEERGHVALGDGNRRISVAVFQGGGGAQGEQGGDDGLAARGAGDVQRGVEGMGAGGVQRGAGADAGGDDVAQEGEGEGALSGEGERGAAEVVEDAGAVVGEEGGVGALLEEEADDVEAEVLGGAEDGGPAVDVPGVGVDALGVGEEDFDEVQ